MGKQCNHQYEAKKSIRKDIIKRYVSDGKYFTETLDQEVITIFCVKCGDSKVVYDSIGLVDDASINLLNKS